MSKRVTMLHVPPQSSTNLTKQVVFIDPVELATVLEADAAV
jgi:hypothetical protein